METIKEPPRKRPEKHKPVQPAGKEDPREPKGSSDDKNAENSDKPSEEEVISHWRNPVTNQDEQEKITNSGGDDIPIADN
jgi:hypothetical protein